MVRQILWPVLGKFCEQNWEISIFSDSNSVLKAAHARRSGACPHRKILNCSSSEMAF